MVCFFPVGPLWQQVTDDWQGCKVLLLLTMAEVPLTVELHSVVSELRDGTLLQKVSVVTICGGFLIRFYSHQL